MSLAVTPGPYANPTQTIEIESGGILKLLLTSGGVTNTSIRETLVDLLGKPIADSNALCIPTAQYGHPWVGPGEKAWRFISGNSTNPMVDLGWKSMGELELTALPSIDEERWVPLVRETDVLLVAGGDVLYLCHWMRQSGLAAPRGHVCEHVNDVGLGESPDRDLWRYALDHGAVIVTKDEDFANMAASAVTLPQWCGCVSATPDAPRYWHGSSH